MPRSNLRSLAGWLALGLALSLQVRAESPGSDTLTAEMLVDLRAVSAVTLDPSGERAAYLLRVPREPGDEPGGAYHELWVAHLEKGRTRRFAGEKEDLGGPAFSPDGKRLTFLAKREEVDEHRQIYSLRVRGGEARPLTRHASDIADFRWSPGGGWIAFRAADAKTEAEKLAEKEGRDQRVDGAAPKYRRLYLFDVKKGTSRQLTEGDLDTRDYAWVPDETALIVRATTTTRIDDDYMFSRLLRLDVASGATAPLAETPGKLGELAVSPDGRHLAYLGAVSQDDPIAQSLFVLDLAGGGAPRHLSEDLAATALHVDWLDDARLLLIAAEGTHHSFFEITAASGERRRLDWPQELVVASFDLLARRDLLAVAAHSAAHPSELYLARSDASGAERFHVHNPGLENVRLARQEVVSWTGPGGVELEGVLTWPLDGAEDGPHPLVLQVHGGPEGVSLNGWTSSAGYPVQLLAKDGHLVLEPNYRGSGGRGVAFSKADHDDLGGAEFDDILAGVDALIERGWVDGQRVGTGGWSYGGYLSAWAATRHTERFAAAVMAAGIANWVSFTGTTDIPYEMSLVHWTSWWFDEPELHWQRSPLAHINRARTPTLILHGADDTRVHPAQGLELHTALRIKEVPSELVIYPREGHGLDERAHQLDAIERVRDWFATHLGAPKVEGVEKPLD